jgi:apolipoprotein N-acyltransferase
MLSASGPRRKRPPSGFHAAPATGSYGARGEATMETLTVLRLAWVGGVLVAAALAVGLGVLVEMLRERRAYRRDRAGATITASPASTSAIPARRRGPNRSPNTRAAAPAATKGTSSANGVTVAAG